jgi:tetratricopeptide (TPR) repeat protein
MGSLKLIPVFILILAKTCPGAGTAIEPPGTPLSNAAISECDAIPDQPRQSNRAALEAALETAERAAELDRNDPKAAFAVFCVLAKLTSLSGFRIGSLFAVHRLHKEIGRALQLFPDYSDALIARGAFLLNLPRLLGGDAREAVRSLQRAVLLEPQRISARLYLAMAYHALDQKTAAKREAEHALELAQAAGRTDQAEDARRLLREWN